MLESINSSLLAKLTTHIKTGTDTQTILRRYQILAIIYVNAMCSLLCFLWNFISWIGFPLPAQGANLGVYPLVIISFVFLKLGYHELSAVSVVGYFHSTIYLLNKMSGASLASLTITIVCPASAFLFSSSAKIHACNIALSMVQHFILMMDINESFKATFTEDQRALVFQMQICSFMMIVLLGLLSYIQKNIQTSLWQAAQMNYERAEKINKEVVQAIEAKDVFVSSLSHEIRNPLNALKGSIDYLFKVVKDPQFLQILENAKLSGEVLLNLVNNVLDAAKLKSDKMELAHIEMTSLDMVKKLIMIHVEKLREKRISAQVCIYKNVPTIMWIDSSRLLQVVMNLFSNAIKFTPNNGNIKLFISWCKDIEKPESLLLPIQDQFQGSSMASIHTVDQEQRDSKPVLLTKTSMETERWYSSSRSKEDNTSDPNTMLEFDQTEEMSHSRKMRTLKSFETRRLQELAFKDVKVSHKYLVWNIDSKKDIDLQELNGAYSLLTKDKSHVNKNGFLKVQISDNGCGISPEHLPKMFEMFSQGGQNVGSVHGGSGLGLWLCKQICQKMGGDIELYTQPGKGTSFVFYVPVDNENLMAEPVYRTNSLRDKVRGLVVDDFSYNREIHKLLLEREGVQVNLANNGKEALERYKAQGNKFYDFIMMDVQMPEMDGFTAAKEIRNWEMENNWRKVDIYFVSGEYFNDREIMADLKAKGQLDETSGVRCLRKPIDVEVVRKIVEKYLKRRKQSTNLLSCLTTSTEDIKKIGSGSGSSGGDSNNIKNSPVMGGTQAERSSKKDN